MTAHSKESLVRSMLLVLLGIVAIFAGAKSLILLIPAATLVWYGTGPILRSGRN